jgi:hypothetical protein
MKSFNSIAAVNIPNSFVTVVSSTLEIDKNQIISIKLGGSDAPENSDLVCRFRYHISTQTIYNENAQFQQILTRKYLAPRNMT